MNITPSYKVINSFEIVTCQSLVDFYQGLNRSIMYILKYWNILKTTMTYINVISKESGC